MASDALKEQRRNLPDGPGVYLFRDGGGKVIYVGKAKSIRKRVAGHFSNRVTRGEVEMVEMALKKLSEHNVVELDDERRASMVSNLMVVLCSERDTQPIVNTGTLYT